MDALRYLYGLDLRFRLLSAQMRSNYAFQAELDHMVFQGEAERTIDVYGRSIYLVPEDLLPIILGRQSVT